MLITTVFASFRPDRKDYEPLDSTSNTIEDSTMKWSDVDSFFYLQEDSDARYAYVKTFSNGFLCDKPHLQVFSNFENLSTNLSKLDSGTLMLLIEKGYKCLDEEITRNLVMNNVVDLQDFNANYRATNYQFKYLYTPDEVQELLLLIKNTMDQETRAIMNYELIN